MYLADFVCILRVCRLYVLSLNVQNLLGRHKIAYLRKSRTLSRTALGDSSQLCLGVYCNECAHLGAHIVCFEVCNSALAAIIEGQICFAICYCFCDFCCEFVVLRGAPFIRGCSYFGLSCRPLLYWSLIVFICLDALLRSRALSKIFFPKRSLKDVMS